VIRSRAPPQRGSIAPLHPSSVLSSACERTPETVRMMGKSVYLAKSQTTTAIL